MADLSITAGSVAVGDINTRVVTVLAGEAVTQGQPVYLNSSDGKYYKCDANAAGKQNANGIALTPASTDGYFQMVVSGAMNLGATLTVGQVYVVSATAGGIAPYGDLTTGHTVTILGVATTAALITIDISNSTAVKP